MTNERPLAGPEYVTASDGSLLSTPQPAPQPAPPFDEHVPTPPEMARQRINELFEGLENAGLPSESWVGVDAEGNAVGVAPDGADGVRYSIEQMLLVNREGALEAAKQVAEGIQHQVTGIAAGEAHLDSEVAAATIQQLQATEGALGQLLSLLDRHADQLKAHHSNLVRDGLISTHNLARAQLARGVQDFWLDFGSLMADLASVFDFAGGVKESAEAWADGRASSEVTSRLERFLAHDGVYEGIKDTESALNTVLTNYDPNADEVPIFNDVFGVVPLIDEQFGGNPVFALQSLKSDLSDLGNLYVDYRKGGINNLNARTAGQLIVRVLKSLAEWDQVLRKKQIEDLIASITAVDTVLPTPFVPFVATNEQKHLALEALNAIREARLALHATFGLVTPGAAATDWPVPPPGLTVDQLLVLIANLAQATDLAIDDGSGVAGAPATVEELDAAIADAEQRRADVIRRRQQLTSRSAGLEYLQEHIDQLSGQEPAIKTRLNELRQTRDDLKYQPYSFTPQLPRSPGGRPSYRDGLPPEFIQPAEIDAAILDLKSDFRNNTEQLGDLRRDQSLLRAELEELPILAAELAALDEQLVALRRERDAQQISDAIDEVVAEEEARAEAAGAAVFEAARSLLSGRWMIAIAIGVIVFGVALGFTFFGGGDETTEVFAATEEPSTDASQAGAAANDPMASATPEASAQAGAGAGDPAAVGGIAGCAAGGDKYLPIPPSGQTVPGSESIPEAVTYAAVPGGLSVCLHIPLSADHEAAIAAGAYFQETISIAVSNALVELTVSTEDGVTPWGRVVQRAGGVELERFDLPDSGVEGDVAVVLIPALLDGGSIVVQIDGAISGPLEFIGIGAGTFNAGNPEPIWSGTVAGDVDAMTAALAAR